MNKNFLLMVVVVALGLAPSISYADVAAQFEQAGAFEKDRRYDEAKAIYETIVTDYPGTENALKAQTRIVIVSIFVGKGADAQAAFDKLVKDFSEHPMLPDALLSIARRYTTSGKYEAANSIFEQIRRLYPDNPFARKAQIEIPKGQIVSYVNAGDDAAAQTAVDKLIADFNEHSDLPEVLYDIAERYEWLKKYKQAQSIHQQNIQRYPKSAYAGRAQLGVPKCVIMSYIDEGNYTAAKTCIDKLTESFPKHPDLPITLHHIGMRYEWAGKADEAIGLYQKIIEQAPDSEYVIDRQLDIRKAQILSYANDGNDLAVREGLDKLFTDFYGHSGLSWAVFNIAEHYLKKASSLEVAGSVDESREYYEKAALICETLTNKLPNSAATSEAYFWGGECYRNLGQYKKSIECYEKVDDNYADHSEYGIAWRALFMTGRNYRYLKEQGLISESEADSKIKTVYEQLLERYPDCEVAGVVRRQLNKYKSD